MARRLTEEEVKEIEEQRALRDRARAAGSTAGMSWIEKERYSQQQLNDRFRQAHEQAMENRRARILANPSGETDTTLRHNVIRDEEMRTARAHEMNRLGKELATREKEAHERRMGMREQGRDAAEKNAEAVKRAAEIKAASEEKIAGINKDSKIGETKIKAESEEKINAGKNETAIKLGDVNYETTVDTAAINARAQAAQQYAQELMKQRMVEPKQALDFAMARARLIGQIEKQNTNKLGVVTINGKKGDEARAEIEKIADERLKGQLPGKIRIFNQ